jgi:hypothetical protein
MNRTAVLALLAVLAHIAWVGTYERGLGDLFGFLFIVLVAAILIPALVRAVRRLRQARR